MAVNQVPVATTGIWGPQVLQYRQQLVAFRQQQAVIKAAGNTILGKINAMVDGSTYTQLESQLSLQAGQGVLLAGQLGSCVGNINDTDSQAAVNAAIDQFCNWIG